MNPGDKTTDEVLAIAVSYLAPRARAFDVEKLVRSYTATNLAKIEATLEFCQRQKRPPAALVMWLKEAQHREKRKAANTPDRCPEHGDKLEANGDCASCATLELMST